MLALVLVVVVRRGTGLETAVRFALAQSGLDSASVGSVEGSWLGRFRLDDLTLGGPGFTLSVPTLSVDLRLRPLLSRRIHVERLAADAPTLRLVASDSEPDTTAPDPRASLEALGDIAAAPPVGSWSFRLDRLELVGGAVEAGRSLSVRDLDAFGSGGADGAGLRAALDSLSAVAARPGASDALGPEFTLSSTALLADGRIELEARAARADGAELVVTLRSGLPRAGRPDVGGDVRIRARTAGIDATTLLPSIDSLFPPGSGAGRPVEASLDLTGTLDSLDLALDARIGAVASATVHGSVLAPFDSAGTRATLRADVRRGALGPDPAALTERALRARVDVTASGPLAAPDEIDAALELDAAPPTLGAALPADGPWRRVARARAGLDAGGGGSWSVDLDGAGAGRLAAAGTVARAPGADRIVVQRLRAEDVQPDAWVGGLPRARLSGGGGGSLERGADDALRWSADISLDSSSFEDTAVDSVGVRARGDLESAVGTLGIVADAGRARADFDVRRTDGGLTFRVDSADVRPPMPDSTTVLRFAARGRLASDTVRLDLDLHPSDLRGVPVDSGRVEVAGVPADLVYRARLIVADSAAVDGRGRVLRSGGLTTIDLDEGRVVNLPLASIPGGEAVGGRLGAMAHFTLRSEPDRPLELEGSAQLRRGYPRVAEGSVDAGMGSPGAEVEIGADVLELRVRPEADGRHRVIGDLTPAEGGALSIEGTLGLRPDTLEADVRAAGTLPEAVALFGGARADSAVAHIAALRTESLRLDGRAEVEGLARGALSADTVRIGAAFGSDGLSVDTLVVRSDVASVDAGGRLRRRADTPLVDTLRAVVEVRELATLSDLLGTGELRGGGGRIDLVLSGHADSTRLEGRLALGSLAAGEISFAAVDGRIDAALDGMPSGPVLARARGRMELEIGRIALPEAEVRSVHVTALGSPDSVRVDVEADVDDLRGAEVSVVVDPRPDRGLVRVDHVRLQLDEDDWRLRTPPAVVSYREGLSVDSLVLAAGDQEMRIQGGRIGDSLDLAVRVDSIDVGTISDLAGFAALEGWASLDADLTGPPSAPDGRVELTGAFGRDATTRSSADVRVDLRGTLATVDARLARDGGHATVRGDVALPTSGGGTEAADSMMLRLEARGLELAWALPFLHPETVSELAGALDADVRLDGTWQDPHASGRIDVRNGLVGLPALGVRWTDLRAAARVEDETLTLDSLDARSGSGSARLAGSVTRTDSLALDLSIDLDEFQAIRSPEVQAVVSGRLAVGGRADAPRVSGTPSVDALDVYLDERVGSDGLEDVELTDRDLEMLRERFGYVPPDPGESGTPLFEATALELDVEVGRDSWIRKRASPEMAVPFSGALEVRKESGGEMSVDGTLELVAGRGFVEQFGRRFELSEGTVEFRGPPADATVDLTATYTVPSHDTPDEAEVTIRLDVEGTREELDLTLSSEPPMENADVVSYIATGRPASGGLSFSGDGSESGLVSTGASLALGQLAGLVESAAQSGVGLDVVEIRQEGLREATLVAGKYVSPRLYVGLAQPVSLREGDGLSLGGEGESEAEVEYEAFRWLLLNLEVSGTDLRLFLRGRFAY